MNVNVPIEGVGTISIPALGAILAWCPSQKGNTGPCNICGIKPPRPFTIPPPATGGPWPVSSDGFVSWFYVTHITPGGVLVLDGYGNCIYTATASACGWSWPSGGVSVPVGGSVSLNMDFLDGSGQRAVGTGTPGQVAQYSSMTNAMAVSNEFNSYYFGTPPPSFP